MAKTTKEVRKLDMRDYIQYHLDLYNLGKLVAVDGPKRGGRNEDQGWWCIGIKYRPPGNESRHDVQFYDKRIDVYLGYKRGGGYWNRRNIRIEIEREAKKVREAHTSDQVWARAQLSITSGRDSGGSFAL